MSASILETLLIGPVAQAVRAASGTPVVDVYKSPACGRCSQGVKPLEVNGFQVIAHDTNDVAARKQRLGVPPGMGSCRTAELGGYLVEGHVPARDIRRPLKERPRARGLALPAMPMGSPGMDGDRKDVIDVLLVKRDGSSRTYASY